MIILAGQYTERPGLVVYGIAASDVQGDERLVAQEKLPNTAVSAPVPLLLLLPE